MQDKEEEIEEEIDVEEEMDGDEDLYHQFYTVHDVAINFA